MTGRILLPLVGEGGVAENAKKPRQPKGQRGESKTRNQNYRIAFLSHGGTPVLKR
jgi:hypothetical protein